MKKSQCESVGKNELFKNDDETMGYSQEKNEVGSLFHSVCQEEFKWIEILI